MREGNLVFFRELPVGYFLWSPVLIWEGWLRECQLKRVFVTMCCPFLAWLCLDDGCRGTVCGNIGQPGNVGRGFPHVLLLGEVML